jgi:repressor of nif and glnA expression
MKKKQEKKPKISPGQIKALVKILNDKRNSVSGGIMNTLIKKGLSDGWNLTEKGESLLREKNIKKQFDFTHVQFTKKL